MRLVRILVNNTQTIVFCFENILVGFRDPIDVLHWILAYNLRLNVTTHFCFLADDTAAIRVSNLSENTQENDLQELFKPFGHIARIYLAKDKVTGQCKGFAFINYYKKEDAAKAIATLNGYGYDHLILSVEWAKPSGS